jgi:citrate lyase subunit beta/citryl-CoA lyase
MRSKLFVPGSRPELFDKAMASAADAVSFDLEDAVVAERKSDARRDVAAFLARQKTGGPLRIVRINGRHTPDYEKDLDAVVCAGLHIVNLPMTEGASDIRDLADRLAALENTRSILKPLGILANIETPKGVRLAAEIAASHTRVIGLQLGFGDLFEPAGIDPGVPLHKAVVRLTVRLAAAEANLPLYDGAYPVVADTEGFRADAQAARAAGLAGKSCIHPSQIATTNEVFFPSSQEIARARTIVEAARERFGSGMGAFVLDGVMIDGPYVDRAQRVLTLATETAQ